MNLSGSNIERRVGWKNPETGELEMLSVTVIDNKGNKQNIQSLLDVVKKLFDTQKEDVEKIIHLGISQFEDVNSAEAFTVGYLTKAVMMNFEKEKGCELHINVEHNPISKKEIMESMVNMLDTMRDKIESNPDDAFDSYFGFTK